MKISDLIFIGIKGSVVALTRATGQQAWATRLKGSDFVNVVLQGNVLLASSYGEIFCLDPLTGAVIWHNPLKGFGIGFLTIAGGDGSTSGTPPVIAAKRRRDHESSSAASSPAVF